MFDETTERALRAALAAHAGQVRKGDGVTPYVAHPVHLALMLARLGCPPRVLQAALLHDVVEDSEDWTPERVRAEFGPAVAAIVAELTEDKSLSWEERKARGIARVATLSRDALAVKAADKLHNLRTLALDLQAATDDAGLWKRFNGGRERTLETSRQLVEALSARCDVRLAAELRAAMAAVDAAASAARR